MPAQRGFTYLGLLIAILLIGTTLAGAGTLWSTVSRRDREAELLFVGDQFRRAITSYREQTPAGQPSAFPRKLEDLLDDKRWPTRRRHLRKLFVDPMSASRDWGTVDAPGGGVMGVYSRSEEPPLKRGNFPQAYEHFAEAQTYRDWKFEYGAGAAASSPAAGTRAGPPR